MLMLDNLREFLILKLNKLPATNLVAIINKTTVHNAVKADGFLLAPSPIGVEGRMKCSPMPRKWMMRVVVGLKEDLKS